jgi:hypothetical protein
LSKRNRLIAGMTGIALLAFPLVAQADVLGAAGRLADGVDDWFGAAFDATEARPSQPFVHPKPALTARAPAPAHISPAALSKIDPIKVAPPAPSIEKPLRRIFCVEYARMRSGLAIMGDAKFWWARARNLYARLSHPVEEAVMVFSGSKRLKRGHVAVVTHIVSPREIIVDQANWQNHGEIDHAMPVLDVSKTNDWSRVKVWNIRAGQFGIHVYPVSGFIAKDLMRQASRD